MADEHQDVEDNTATTTTTTVGEDDLELSLSLRPLNCSNSYLPSSNLPKNLPETSSPAASNGQILSKRDAQALRRQEAKLKRELKRKSSLNNDVVGANPQQEDFMEEQRRKVLNLGFQGAAPPWFGLNAGAVYGGFMPYQGQNGNFTPRSEGKDAAGVSFSSGSSSGISDNYQSISGPGNYLLIKN